MRSFLAPAAARFSNSIAPFHGSLKCAPRPIWALRMARSHHSARARPPASSRPDTGMAPRGLPAPPDTPTDARILDTAAEHIRRFGVERTSVTGIAEAAGMSHANVYRYYPSKTALFDEITVHWLKPLEAGLRIIADAQDPAFDKLERMVFAVHRGYRHQLESDPKIFRL